MEIDLHVKSQQLLERISNCMIDRYRSSFGILSDNGIANSLLDCNDVSRFVPNFTSNEVHAVEKWLSDFIKEIKNEY